MKIEKRFFSSELRAEETADGKVFLTGRAASYNVVSRDLGGFKERLMPGCFDDALSARDLDVVHSLNHDPSKLLGRTASKTTQLRSDSKGLVYKTLMPPVSYADDLIELVKRGDVNASSFAFTVDDPDDESWDANADDPDVPGQRCVLRSIHRIGKLYDVSSVTNAAYPSTSAGLSDRSLPSSMPAEIRSRILLRAADEECDCTCAFCRGGACDECDNTDCDSPDCEGCPQQADSRGNRGRRSGDGEKLVKLAEDYFQSDASDDDKAGVWTKLEELAIAAGIDEDDERAARDRQVALACAQW